MRNLNRYPLSALRAVEAAGRLGGLAKAAEELGVTPGAISQHVRRIEDQLGRSLFERTPRGLRPTSAGAALLRTLTSAFRDMAQALDKAEARTGSTLTVSVAPVLASKWLVPRLSRFHANHPEIRLRIDAAVDLVDFDVSDIDAGVRVGKGPWPRTKAEKIVELRLFPVCSPKLAERLKTFDDLAKLPAIADHGSPGRWRQWLTGQGRGDLELRPGPTYSDAGLCLEAAIAGQGVAMAWPTLAVDALRAGLVRAPFPQPVPAGEFYWLVTGASRAASPPLRAFGRWLRDALASDAGSEINPPRV